MSLAETDDLISIHRAAANRKDGDTASFRHIQERCRMVALNACETPLQTIAWLVDRHPSVVTRWLARVAAGDELGDRVRSGRPPLFSESMQLKTIAFHCQTSPLPGTSSWSFRWAEVFLNQHPDRIGRTVSRSTIQRILAKHSLRPHLHKYFLAITDPDFFPKMDHLINVYLNPPEYLFCYDECTGLQAKSRLAPDLQAGPDQPRKIEFDYARHGTTDLLAFLNVRTGGVFGRCTLNHNSETLSAVFREHVDALPANATLHYIMDNLSTHFNDVFCRTVADLSGVSYSPLRTGIQRRQWLQSEDKRIVIHYTPFHGSWLNLVEIWFGILNQRGLRHQDFLSILAEQEAILAFIDTWNQWFAHPFTWTYTGEGLQENAIARFNRLLLIESQQMGIKFLSKQLLLMKNIVTTYPEKAETPEWRRLTELLPQKATYIEAIVEDEPTERRRTKATQALQELRALLN